MSDATAPSPTGPAGAGQDSSTNQGASGPPGAPDTIHAGTQRDEDQIHHNTSELARPEEEQPHHSPITEQPPPDGAEQATANRGHDGAEAEQEGEKETEEEPADDEQFDLARFVAAQNGGDGVYTRALAELRVGCKWSHWTWFVFPQLRGLGDSAMSTVYGVDGPAEARAYERHAVLGPRLHEAARAVRDGPAASALALMSGNMLDVLKLWSSMTLFDAVVRERHGAAEENPFAAVLDRFWGGERDAMTVAMWNSAA